MMNSADASPSQRLTETLKRIGDRVDAYKAEECEKVIAHAWCRANGNPHTAGRNECATVSA